MLDEDKLRELLGRSLTAFEATNYATLIDIAQERLEQVLCARFVRTGEAVATERLYEARSGYRSLVVDPFTGTPVVEIDGEATTDFLVRQFERYDGTWYNTIQFDDRMAFDIEDPVSVTAIWGYGECLPKDLELLLARMFAGAATTSQGSGRVKSKEIEGFRVDYDTSNTDYAQFLKDNAPTVRKYSQCSLGEVSHGDVFYGFIL